MEPKENVKKDPQIRCATIQMFWVGQIIFL